MIKQYDKPFLSFERQIDLLKNRGLVIKDELFAEQMLSTMNYYRLAAYFYYFQSDHVNHRFREGVSIEQIFELYEFDRRLRNLLLEALSFVEISLRTSWAYYLSRDYGSHGYLLSDKVKSEKHLSVNLDDLDAVIDKSSEDFINHYKRNYNDPPMPPVWVVCEVMSFGQLSRWYANMKPSCTAKKSISYRYRFHELEFEGVLEHLVYVRNICAHHGRVWNKSLKIKMLPDLKTKPNGLRAMMMQDEDYNYLIYNTIVVLLHLMGEIQTSDKEWLARLKSILNDFPHDLSCMGFRADWLSLRLFKSV